MSINEFMLENNIAIFVEVDVPGKSFNTYKSDIELEYYSLYEQLILYSDAESLAGTDNATNVATRKYKMCSL